MALNEVSRDEPQSVLARLKEALCPPAMAWHTDPRAGVQAAGRQARQQPGVSR
jgi:hypothetical protein